MLGFSLAAASLTLVVGKGGVGRTTVARALAWKAKQRGRRAICLALDTGLSTRSQAEWEADVVALSASAALETAAAPVFGSRRIASAVLGQFAMQRLLDVIPGIREYALLVAARELSRSHDHVVVDMPATGHGVAWLGAASRLARLVSGGRSREQADQLDSALRDPRQTSLVVVSLPEPLVLVETLDLREQLRSELGRDADLLVVNRVPEAPLQTAQAARGHAVAAPEQSEALLALAAWLDQRGETRERARAAGLGVASTWLRDYATRPALADIAAALAVGAPA
jgi:arsenite/tail-anchored protein-transporting ATPase